MMMTLLMIIMIYIVIIDSNNIITKYYLFHRWGYAIYSSVGSLDLECDEPLSLGMTKDMISVPIILSMRSEVRYEFDKAWHHLSTTDTTMIQYSARIQSSVAAKAGDPDDLKITFKILMKILKETSFSKYIEVGARFGKKGKNSAGFFIFYHGFLIFFCLY